MNSAVLQTGIVTPLLLLLAAYTATRPEGRRVHGYLSALLCAMGCWCALLVLAFAAVDLPVRQVAFDCAQTLAIAILPLALLTIAHYNRVEVLERGFTGDVILAAPAAFFLIAAATNSSHHWMHAEVTEGFDLGRPDLWAGPIFWAFQIWTVLYVAGCFGICAWKLRSARSPLERRRVAILVGALMAPVLAHSTWAMGLIPLEFPLTPLSFGVTGLFLVAGIQRFELLDRKPVVRRDIIDCMSDGLVLADADGVVIDANPSAAEILRTSVEGLLGLPVARVVERLMPRSNLDEIERALVSASSRDGRFSTEIETDDERIIEIAAVEIDDRGSQPAGRFLLLRDRSGERRAERLLRHRQKLESVGILAAGIAHEVNNPLAFVRANLAHIHQLAEDFDEKAEPDAEAWVELAEVASESLVGLDRIGRIVDGLLRFSRPSEGCSEVDCNALVEETIRFASLHRSPNVVVETDLDPDLPRVVGSPDRLLQALLNLLLNARQALAERADAQIRVTTRRDSEAVEIAIADNGPGIDPELQERIFDPFFTTRAAGEGTGLGLSIAYDIVREHEGHLDLASRPGDGACFTVRLPV